MGKNKMKIAIDFDNTYTLDPEFWDRFIANAKASGHKVWCVTARRNTEENRETVVVPGVLTVFSELGSKIDCMERRGIKIDVWIDDDPLTCARGR